MKKWIVAFVAIALTNSFSIAVGQIPCMSIQPCSFKTTTSCPTAGYEPVTCFSHSNTCDPNRLVNCLNAIYEIKLVNSLIDAHQAAEEGQTGYDQVCFDDTFTVCWRRTTCNKCDEWTNPFTFETGWYCQAGDDKMDLTSYSNFYMQGSCIGMGG